MDTLYRCFRFSKDHIDAYDFDSYATGVDHCRELAREDIRTIFFMKNEEDPKWVKVAAHVDFEGVVDPVGDLPIVFHDTLPDEDGLPVHWDNLP